MKGEKQMKYSDPKLTNNVKLQREFKLVQRSKPKKNGRYTSVLSGHYYYPITDIFSFAVMNMNWVNDIFSEDAELMIVENIGRIDKIIFPSELKKLIVESDILFKDDYCEQKKIDNCIKKHLDEIK